MTNKIKIQVDNVAFNVKPTKADTARIKPRLQTRTKPTELTVEEIAQHLKMGKTISPGVLNGGCRAENWIEQRIFFVDIDNKEEEYPIMSIQDALNICKENNLEVSLVYHTFSNSEQLVKFRLAFVCDEVIKEEYKRNIIIETLTGLFNQADTNCKNADRLIYGTNQDILYTNNDATFSFDTVMEINQKYAIQSIQEELEKVEEQREENNVQKNDTGHKNNDYKYDLRKEIADFDLFDYLQKEVGDISYKCKKYAMFHYCPICDGHDDLVYYFDDKVFTCFGKTGRQTGNIINFLVLTKKMTKHEAAEYFLYEIKKLQRPEPKKEFTPMEKFIYAKTKSNNLIEDMYKKLYLLKIPPHKYSWDDKGTSEIFGNITRELIRYNITTKNWMFYTGKYWKNDESSSYVNKYMKFFTDALYLYASDDNLFKEISDDKTREKTQQEYKGYVCSLGSKHRRDAIVKDAQSENPISNQDLDMNTNILNLQNGTYDLTTHTLKEHRAEDFLSKIANVEYNPNASYQDFETFINEVLQSDEEKIGYLKRIMGYTLTAETKEECLFVMYGSTTRNGKSTLLETIEYMLGDYAKHVNPETFATKKISDSRTASGDIARLNGTRFVNLSEPPKNMTLNVALVKSLTGRDTVTARFIYQHDFEFIPVFKMFMNTNYLPLVDDETIFSSGRINVITFNRHFNIEEQDKNLKDKLKTKENISGLFNWCIEGLKEYRKQGLNTPLCVLDANNEYQGVNDIITPFIEECFDKSEQYTKAKEAYNVFCAWCTSNKYAADKYTIFLKRLEKRNLLGVRNGNRNLLIGLEIKSEWII